jgi:hypothetical protein
MKIIQNQMTSEETQLMMQQHNPYKEFEPAFDIVPLPSKGIFYPEVDGKKVDSVKVYYLTAEDEGIMTSPNIINSGKLLDTLLEKKVECSIPLTKLLTGDRVAILVFLRATMEQFYKVMLIDPKTRQPFEHAIDLMALEQQEMEEQPNDKGMFDFILPKCQKRVTFKLMTHEDELEIKMAADNEKSIRKSDENFFNFYKLMRLVVNVEGINDMFAKEKFLKSMPMMDARRLHAYMDKVTPTIQLDIEVAAPSGGRFRADIPITAEFFYPAI